MLEGWKQWNEVRKNTRSWKPVDYSSQQCIQQWVKSNAGWLKVNIEVTFPHTTHSTVFGCCVPGIPSAILSLIKCGGSLDICRLAGSKEFTNVVFESNSHSHV